MNSRVSRLRFIAAAGLAMVMLAGCIDLRQAKVAAQNGNREAAVEHWQRLAPYGFAEAQTELGLSYLRGDGAEPDMTRALYWLSKAAVQDDAKALFEIGRVYSDGIGGIKPHYAAAWAYLDRAAALGYPRALVEMSDMVAKGRGMPPDSVRAERMLRQASDMGVGNATARLARTALKAGDTKKAQTLYERAWAQGHFESGVDLARLSAEGGQLEDARWYYQSALAQGALPDKDVENLLAGGVQPATSSN